MPRRRRKPLSSSGALHRRDFLVRCAASGSVALGSSALAHAASCPASAGDAKADAVLQIFLQGGLSHHESWDPKPDAPAEYRGEFGAVDTKVDGLQLGQLMRRTARIADRLTILRSMTHSEAAHERGTHGILTGYAPSPAITYPSMGSVVAHELGGRKALPPYIAIPNAQELYLGTGYLSSSFAPFAPGGDPNRRGYKVRDLEAPNGISKDRAARRRALLADLDHDFAAQHADVAQQDAVVATQRFYEQAYELATSKEAKEAFRIDKEPRKLRDAYGRTSIGQQLLMARRLVQAGARWVTVRSGGWDHHQRIGSAIRGRLGQFDLAFSTLIRDLEKRGMLERTIVLVVSEFGRTPRINANGGRDHWPRVFSVVAAGSRYRRGHVHGASDEIGANVAEDAVSPADLAATTFSLLGIEPEKRLLAPGGRPIDIVRNGRVLREVLA